MRGTVAKRLRKNARSLAAGSFPYAEYRTQTTNKKVEMVNRNTGEHAMMDTQRDTIHLISACVRKLYKSMKLAHKRRGAN